jgi:hypothetical protein
LETKAEDDDDDDDDQSKQDTKSISADSSNAASSKKVVFERIKLLGAGKKEIEASMATSPLAPATATSEISILAISHYGFLHVYEVQLKEQ